MLSCIVAIGENNELGKNNKMPWHIKKDLAYFKKTTLNKKIIMGRKTFESLPNLLPNRQHIVITNNQNFSAPDSVIVQHNLLDVLNKYKISSEEVFIIGGGTIYKEALSFCDKLYLTRIHKSFEADVFFPEINLNEFKLIEKSDVYSESEINFTFETYSRRYI